MPDGHGGAHPAGWSGASGGDANRPDGAYPADGAGRSDGAAGSAGAAPRSAGSRIASQVRQFHRAYLLPIADRPVEALAPAQARLRQSLIDEEVGELRRASDTGDLIGVADALADIVYVAYGTACVYGIDLDAVLDEVHASNMTKLGADGQPVRRADGKVLKGPHYRPPDVAAALFG